MCFALCCCVIASLPWRCRRRSCSARLRGASPWSPSPRPSAWPLPRLPCLSTPSSRASSGPGALRSRPQSGGRTLQGEIMCCEAKLGALVRILQQVTYPTLTISGIKAIWTWRWWMWLLRIQCLNESEDWDTTRSNWQRDVADVWIRWVWDRILMNEILRLGRKSMGYEDVWEWGCDLVNTIVTSLSEQGSQSEKETEGEKDIRNAGWFTMASFKRGRG